MYIFHKNKPMWKFFTKLGALTLDKESFLMPILFSFNQSWENKKLDRLPWQEQVLTVAHALIPAKPCFKLLHISQLISFLLSHRLQCILRNIIWNSCLQHWSLQPLLVGLEIYTSSNQIPQTIHSSVPHRPRGTFYHGRQGGHLKKPLQLYQGRVLPGQCSSLLWWNDCINGQGKRYTCKLSGLL